MIKNTRQDKENSYIRRILQTGRKKRPYSTTRGHQSRGSDKAMHTIHLLYYVEYVHWEDRPNTFDGYINNSGNMIAVNNEYDRKKAMCDKVFDRFKTHQFVWRNQTFTALVLDLFQPQYGYLPESSYNNSVRNMLDEFYPRPLATVV